MAVLTYGVGDTVTTWYSTRYPEIYEGNPLVQPLLESHGWVALVLIKLAFFVLAYLFIWLAQSKTSITGKYAIGGIAGVGALVTVWNSVMIAIIEYNLLGG